MRDLRRRLIVACVAGLIASGVSFASTPAVADYGCAEVKFFGLRGSGETENDGKGYGETVEKALNSFTDELDDRGISHQETRINYRAVQVWPVSKDTFEYEDSVQDGVDKLSEAFSAAIAACEDQEFVFSGYSQGANVIKQFLLAIEGTDSRTKVKGILLFGDPTLNPKDGSLYPRRPGRFPGGMKIDISVPDWVTEKRNYCLTGDPLCHGTPHNLVECIKLNWEKPCPHGYYKDEVAQEGGKWLAGLADGNNNPPPVPNPRPTPTNAPVQSGGIEIISLTPMYKGEPVTVAPCNKIMVLQVSLENRLGHPQETDLTIGAYGSTNLIGFTGKHTLAAGPVRFESGITPPISNGVLSFTARLTITYDGKTVTKESHFSSKCFEG